MYLMMDTKNNPADCASCGLKPGKYDVDLWFKGHSFLEDQLLLDKTFTILHFCPRDIT